MPQPPTGSKFGNLFKAPHKPKGTGFVSSYPGAAGLLADATSPHLSFCLANDIRRQKQKRRQRPFRPSANNCSPEDAQLDPAKQKAAIGFEIPWAWARADLLVSVVWWQAKTDRLTIPSAENRLIECKQLGALPIHARTLRVAPRLPRLRRVGGVVTQRIANPCTPVRFRYSPPTKSMAYMTAESRALEIGGGFGGEVINLPTRKNVTGSPYIPPEPAQPQTM